jgi:hypothetical protein
LEPFAASQPTAFSHFHGALWRCAVWLSSAVSQRCGALMEPAFSETNAMPPHVSCASPLGASSLKSVLYQRKCARTGETHSARLCVIRITAGTDLRNTRDAHRVPRESNAAIAPTTHETTGFSDHPLGKNTFCDSPRGHAKIGGYRRRIRFVITPSMQTATPWPYDYETESLVGTQSIVVRWTRAFIANTFSCERS